MIKSHQITRGAMSIALFALLVLANQQFSLMIETYLPWLFALPIYVYVAKEPLKASWCVLLSMAICLLIFSWLTTWILAGSFLITGFLLGLMTRQAISRVIALLLTFCLLVGVNFLSTVVLSALFGYDLQGQLKELQQLVPWFRPAFALTLVILLTSAMEVLVTYLSALVLGLRLGIPMPKMGDIWQLQAPVWAFWLTLISVILTAIYIKMGQGPILIQEGMILVWLIGMVGLDYWGVIVLGRWLSIRDQMQYFGLIVMAAFILPINIFWILIGWWNILSKSILIRRNV